MECSAIRLSNGDLEITVDAESQEELREQESRGFWSNICELFESYSCNGSYQPFDAGDANPFVGLTDAPCIAECMDVADDGTQSIDGDFWYYGDYMIRDPLDDLRNAGRTVFTLARE